MPRRSGCECCGLLSDSPLVKLRVWLKVHKNIADVGELAQQLILDKVADAMALIDGLIRANLNVDIDEILEARLADPGFIDPLDAWNRRGRAADLVHESTGGLGVHQLLGLAQSRRVAEVTITATTKRAAI